MGAFGSSRIAAGANAQGCESMSKKHKPHSGSKAYYPKVRAKKETPSFSTFNRRDEKSIAGKALNFIGYKAGMMQVMGTDKHERAVSYGQEVAIAGTVVECPALKVFGVRAYGKQSGGGTYGLKVLGDVYAEKIEKDLLKKIKGFKKKKKKSKNAAEKEGKEQGGNKKEKAEKTLAFSGFADLEAAKEKIVDVRLLVHTQPRAAGVRKKRPDICEISIGGTAEEQIAFAKGKLGAELRVDEVFETGGFADVKGVDKGHGFSGVIKRAGVKTGRPKAKKYRVVGSIGPWNPSTVMWTVARPGQLGYQNRTELNKRVLVVGNNVSTVNPASGFKNYGNVKSDFMVVAGSVPGPAKRAIAMRLPMRETPAERFNIADVKSVRGELLATVADVKEAPAEKNPSAQGGDKK